MMYGVTDAGIVDVLKAVENAPFVPIVAGCEIELIVIVIISPLAGKIPPAETVPDKLIELVPTEILCEGVRPLNTVPVAEIPVPWRPTDCMLLLTPRELSVKVRVADSGPMIDGWKVT